MLPEASRPQTPISLHDRPLCPPKAPRARPAQPRAASESVTLESLREDTSAYLLPEYGDDRERDEILREFLELFGWWTDEQAHPAERTFQMFQEWFEVEFHSMVVDLLEDEIESEPL